MWDYREQTKRMKQDSRELRTLECNDSDREDRAVEGRMATVGS